MRLTELAHNYLNTQLKAGDHVIDATAGNGYDTAHLASLVGDEGHVIAIDIQETAINATRERLSSQNALKQVRLRQGDHSKILQLLCTTYAQTISAITFNLGYLPRSDKSVQTTPETTLCALDASKQLLKPNGLLLVTAYREHKGGQNEADAVAKWMQQVESDDWLVDRHNPIAKEDKLPPILYIARRPPTNPSVNLIP